MKNLKIILAVILTISIIAVSLNSRADNSTNAPAKPYPLDTCLVCGMKFGSMGEPYVFVYKGQEIKVCDKYEQAETVLRMRRTGGGYLGEMFRTAMANNMVRDLEEAQAESEIRCF